MPRTSRTSPAAAAVVLSAVMLSAVAACGSGGPPPGGAADSTVAVATTSCSYPDAGSPSRPVHRPDSLGVPDDGTLPVTLRTSAGPLHLTLSRSQAPCTVHSIESLARQSYFVDTPCHRLTAPPSRVSLLQCGDPTGTGAGGPGYAVPDEPPGGLAPADDAAGDGAVEAADGTDDAAHSPPPGDVIYPRGTVALSNRGVRDSGGSQFFLVYADSPLPPDYTVFGSVDPPSLPVLDAIAAHGTDSATAPGDGHPNTPVTIEAMRLPPR